MATHTFDFRPPRWHPPEQVNIRTSLLAAGSGLWLLLYAWLALRLWRGFPVADRPNLLLIGLSIALGVLLILAWRKLTPKWSLRWRARQRWSALEIDAMQRLTPSEFETYVAQRLFVRQGYQVFNTPDVKDGGVDILLTDAYGDLAVVQCKRYKGTVGEATVRDLYGAMFHAGATQAYLVTSGSISESARRWAYGKPIELIDGERLVQLAKSEPVFPSKAT